MNDAGSPSPTAAAGPDFLCIGAMKAGTTWLHGNLAEHRGFWLPPLKELRYFNSIHIPGPHQEGDPAGRATQIEARLARLRAPGRVLGPRQRQVVACLEAMAEGPQSDAWYTRIFGFRGPGDVTGDICPQYALLPEAGIRHALALNPRLKAVALLRDPASRALAHMAMHCGPGATAAAVLARMQTPRWDALYYGYSDYAAWLGRWRATLPPDSLHVEVMPAIKREPQAVLRRISAFLGVPAGPRSFPKAGQAVMVGRSDRNALAPALPVLREALAPVYARLEAEWPEVAAALREEG